MRHLKKNNHLSRTRAHRRAMLANMASSLIIHKRIKTTVAKAKALRIYVEPLITRSKDDSTHSRRVVFGYLQNKEALTELFREVSPKVFNRPGGYTRIIKLGNRLGDNAEMCLIELVDYNEHLLDEAKDAKSKSTRRGGRRRGGKKKSDSQEVETTKKAEPVKEETDTDQPKETAEDKKIEDIAEKAEEEKAEVKKDESKAKKEEEKETKIEDKKEEKTEEKKEEPKQKVKKEEKPEPKAEKKSEEKQDEKSGKEEKKANNKKDSK